MINDGVNDGVKSPLNPSEEKAVKAILRNSRIKAAELAKILGVKQRQAERIIASLKRKRVSGAAELTRTANGILRPRRRSDLATTPTNLNAVARAPQSTPSSRKKVGARPPAEPPGRASVPASRNLWLAAILPRFCNHGAEKLFRADSEGLSSFQNG